MSEQYEEKRQRGIQSVEVAAQLLDIFIGPQRAMSLKETASAVGMSSARVLPYLVSLVRSGLLRKDEGTGLYEPGSLSQELGILGLHYQNPANEAEVVSRALAEATGHAIVLSVWGALGPTVIRIDESRYSLYSEIRLGSVMSLANSATGRVFSAWMPLPIVEASLAQEAIRAGGHTLSDDEHVTFLNGLDAVRARRVEIRPNAPMPGLSAMSAPVFGLGGEIVFALTLFDESSAMDLEPDGRTARALLEGADELSRGLGHAIDSL